MMTSSPSLFSLVLVLLTVALSRRNAQAYVLVQQQKGGATRVGAAGWRRHRHVVIPAEKSRLYMEDDNDTGGGGEKETAVDEAASSEEAASEEEEEEGQEEEDPVMVALKEEIASLEKEVKEKRRQAMDMSDRADDYTQSGYQRKVAEMENMRRARSMLNSSNKFTATSSVLAEFVPTLDRLSELGAKYQDNAFGRQYDALPGAVKAAFSEMGAQEYTAIVGEPVDKNRLAVIESVHSDDMAADMVLRPIRVGIELKGNVIRMAECVASLGPEKSEEEDAAAPEGDAPSEEESDQPAAE